MCISKEANNKKQQTYVSVEYWKLQIEILK
jgi:hypothetical protein